MREDYLRLLKVSVFTVSATWMTIKTVGFFATGFLSPFFLVLILSFYLKKTSTPQLKNLDEENAIQYDCNKFYTFFNFFIFDRLVGFVLFTTVLWIFVIFCVNLALIMVSNNTIESIVLSTPSKFTYLFASFLSTFMFTLVFFCFLSKIRIYRCGNCFEIFYLDSKERQFKLENVENCEVKEGRMVDKVIIEGDDFNYELYTKESEKIQKDILCYRI